MDVHRKNSSESSEGGLHLNRGDSTEVTRIAKSENNSVSNQLRHQRHQQQQHQQRRASTQPPVASVSSVTEAVHGGACASRTSLESPPADATSEFNINWAMNHTRLQSLASLPYLGAPF